MVTLHEVITFLVSMQISISSLQTHNVNRCGRSRHLARDRKSGSAGMPRPISYAVFCLKKKRAKGASRRRVVIHHILRNSLLPVVTMLGMDIGVALGGSVFIE